MKMLSRYLPLLVIIGAFIWAGITIQLTRTAETPRDTQVIRIGHWQLESGVRDGFNELGKVFAELPEIKAKYGKIKIIQDAIPEGTYGTWVSTQMLSGKAPDLVEIGIGLPYPIWLGYQNRYFFPLTTLANSSNPFNKGTALEGIPLKNTICDGMRSCYQEELQEYMRVSISRFSARVFYNRTLLKKLTGLDAPPKNYGQFLDVCRKIASQKDSSGQAYVPIASSKYHVGMWQGGMFDPLTYAVLTKADFNRDGSVGNDETFVAFKTGTLTFNDLAVRAKFEVLHDIKAQFQTGFTGLNRDEAVFLFAQQQAVFISSGTWDVGSLVEQAKGKFDVGAMTFPQPAKDDPKYGSLVFGPVFDPAGPGFAFGVTRFSKNPDLAKDFLLFMVSKQANARMNEIIGWLPAVSSVAPSGILAGFAPVNEGQLGCLQLEIGGESGIKYQQLYSKFQTDPNYTLDQFLKEYSDCYMVKGLKDWQEQQRDWRRGIINNELFLASLRGEALSTAAEQGDSTWVRYRAFTTNRQVTPEIGHAWQADMVNNGPNRPVGPYDYLPEAMVRIRQNLANEAGSGAVK